MKIIHNSGITFLVELFRNAPFFLTLIKQRRTESIHGIFIPVFKISFTKGFERIKSSGKKGWV